MCLSDLLWGDVVECNATLPRNVKCPLDNERRLANVGAMLGQRRRRWANIVPTLAKRLVLAGVYLIAESCTVDNNNNTMLV